MYVLIIVVKCNMEICIFANLHRDQSMQGLYCLLVWNDRHCVFMLVQLLEDVNYLLLRKLILCFRSHGNHTLCKTRPHSLLYRNLCVYWMFVSAAICETEQEQFIGTGSCGIRFRSLRICLLRSTDSLHQSLWAWSIICTNTMATLYKCFRLVPC